MGKRKGPRQTAAVADIRRDLGLDDSAEFVGYGVHRPDTDEFLALAKFSRGVEQWVWARYPDYGLHFPSFTAAQRLATRYDKPCFIVYLFDEGPRYRVAWVV